MAADTGNGATLAFANDSFDAAIVNASVGSRSLGMIDKSDLSTTGNMVKLAADLVDQGPITGEYLVDVTASSKFAPSIGPGFNDTLTITFPGQLGGADATYAVSGHITDIDGPNIENNTLMRGTFEFTPDGVTGPTFTVEAAS